MRDEAQRESLVACTFAPRLNRQSVAIMSGRIGFQPGARSKRRVHSASAVDRRASKVSFFLEPETAERAQQLNSGKPSILSQQYLERSASVFEDMHPEEGGALSCLGGHIALPLAQVRVRPSSAHHLRPRSTTLMDPAHPPWAALPGMSASRSTAMTETPRLLGSQLHLQLPDVPHVRHSTPD